MVLVGDPMQLDATVLSPVASEGGLKLSLFSRIFEKLKPAGRVFMLTEQVSKVLLDINL